MIFRRFISCFWLKTLIQCLLFEVICSARSCGYPGNIPNGRRIGNLFTFPNKVEFECNEGYLMIGLKELYCQASGEWNGHIPYCYPIYCSPPRNITNGRAIYYSSVYGSALRYECNKGFTLRNHQPRFCGEDGKWSNNEPKCEEENCSDPGISNHGKVQGKCCSLGDTLHYSCLEGYERIGNKEITCQSTGQWSSNRPLCRPLEGYCELPPAIPHGVVIGVKDGDYFLEGSRLEILCESGYKYTGSHRNVFCENGKWTAEFGRCIKIYCIPPEPPANGIIIPQTSLSLLPYHYGINYNCNEGYRLLGGDNWRFCGKYGWTGTAPYCVDSSQYSFENGAQVKDVLHSQTDRKIEEQNTELPKSSPNSSATFGGIMGINFPDKLIIYFVFDVSRSVGRSNFEKSIDFAKAIVEKVGISRNGTRAGALTFNSREAIVFLPMHFETTKDVVAALDRIEYKAAESAVTPFTPVTPVLSRIRQRYIPLSHDYYGIKNVRSVIFVLTDGKTNMGGSLTAINEAKLMKKAGVEIYSIGVSGTVREDLLNSIASTSHEGNPKVYILQNYASMDSLVEEILKGKVDYSQCGLIMENETGEVSGGRIGREIKSKKPWPWMAALFMPYIKSNRLYTGLQCGGSIITEKFILTAAHCIYYETNWEDVDKEYIIVKLGLTDVKNKTFLQEYKVEKILIHPRYRPGNHYDYDIALLRLDRKIVFNAFVRPICLPPKELPLNSSLYSPGELGWALAWKYNTTSSVSSTHRLRAGLYLKEIVLPIQPEDRCIQSLVDNRFNASFFTNRMFCAGDGRGETDTCKGDSGGPIMQRQMNSDGYHYWTQVGIISWGIGCKRKRTYGYYSHVQRLRPWIDSTILEEVRDTSPIATTSVGLFTDMDFSGDEPFTDNMFTDRTSHRFSWPQKDML